MKRILLLPFLMFFFPMLSFGGPFEEAVIFNIDLAALSNRAVAERAAGDRRVVILEGLMGDFLVDEVNGEIRVWVNLVGGAWIGTDEVRAYNCRIAFIGEQWLEAFPPKRPKEPGGRYVPPGSRLLVAVRVTGFDVTAGSSLAEMVDFRVLD